MELTSHYQLEEFGKGQKTMSHVLPPPRILLAEIHLGWAVYAPPVYDPKSDWLARVNRESKPVTETARHVTEQFSCVLLPCCSLPGLPFPIKSLVLSAHVSVDNSFLSVKQEPTLRPWKGPPSCNTWMSVTSNCSHHTFIILIGGTSVTESKIVLQATWHVNKLEDKVWGLGIYDFILKARSPRRWHTKVLENHLAGVGMLASFIEQRVGVWGDKVKRACVCVCVCVCVWNRFSRVQLFATLWTVAHQAPLSLEFSKQEYWSELPCPPPRDLPSPGIETRDWNSYVSCIGRWVLHH